MKYVLDTNICIYIIKKKPQAVINKITKVNVEDLYISSITYAELFFGVLNSEYVEKNRVALALFLSNISVLNFDKQAAEAYGEIRTDLEKKGVPIGERDMLIASNAKALGYTLVTNNEREFNRIKGLKVENWVK